MGEQLNMFPARVPIGRVTDASGQSYDVLMTLEFARALSSLMTRVGGPINFTVDELASLISMAPSDAATIAAMQRTIVNQATELGSYAGMAARMAALERKVASLDVLANGARPAPVDWEHPGKIGAATANSGKFSALEAVGKVNLHPKDLAVDLKPTGTSLLTIQPEQPGQIDNMELGKVTPRPARVQTLNKITFTQPAAGATCTLADGKTFTVNSSLTLTGTDGATLNVGGGGTLGSAAYSAAGSFAARTATALSPVATDAASTQTLANSLRAVLLSVGIGS